MNWKWRGNTATVATSPIQNLPNTIESFRLVNKTGGTIGVNVYIFTTATPANQFSIAPNSVQLAVNTKYEETESIVLLASEQIKVQTEGSVDFDFTLKNLE